ncbi:MAG: DUF1492 domain-containing protein [Bacteroidaceae bacterium]|nr:DUF1492 domain-containing protein [Bacteroidaceae bacterium]
MTAREYMARVRKAETELKLIADKKLHYAELATSIGVKLTGMPHGGGNTSKVETSAVGIVDLMSELEKKEKEYIAFVKEAEALIEKLPQEKFRMVLVLRYICGHSWKLIRDEMDYADEKSVFRCHGYALKALQRIM